MISTSLTALVVENETDRAERLVKLLSRSTRPFVNCHVAETLAEASELFKSARFGVVFTRLQLPDASGLEALVRFHQLKIEAPIIAVLDRVDESIVNEAAQSLADDCLFWDDLDSEALNQSIGFAIDRRQMLQELHEQNPAVNSDDGSAFSLLLDRIDEALLVVSRQDSSLLFCNNVAQEWFGFHLESALQEVLEFGVLEGEELEIVASISHFAVSSAELRSTWLDWKGIPACMVTLRDISKRKRAEEAFVTSQRRLELALKASNIGMWSWEFRTNRLAFSERWKLLLGFKCDEYPDTLVQFRASLHPEDREPTIKEFMRYVRNPWPDFECEYRMLHKNGSYRHILCRAELFSDDDGNLSKMLGSHIDITERKNQETAKALVEKQLQEQQRFESLGSLAGGMAHCMNNLLTSMMGNVALLREEALSSGMPVDRIQKIDHCSHQAAELCQKLLSFSGKGGFVAQPLQLNETIFDCKEIIEISLAEGAKVDFQLAKELPDIVADRSELQRLLLNLVMNASEAVEGQDTPVLLVKTRTRDFDGTSLESFKYRMNAQPGTFVCLEIEDNGIGMSPEIMERAFEPFFSTKFKGRGLGLSAVKGIVNSNGGFIDLESSENKGARIGVFFPKAKNASLIKSITRSEKKKALIAEDEEILRKVMTSMLTSFGYEPILAEDGQVALNLYEKHCDELAIALIDLNMPRMNGANLFKSIRSRCQDLPIILMSGDGEEVDFPFEDCESERCRYLNKPFGMEELKLVMSSLIDSEAESLVSS